MPSNSRGVSLGLIFRLTMIETNLVEFKQQLLKKDQDMAALSKKIEFLEETHLTKASYFSTKEKSYQEKIKVLEDHVDRVALKEAEDQEAHNDRKQKWRLKEKKYINIINAMKINGESEWLNIYNNLMDQVGSLKRDVEHLRIEKEILTKRSKISSPR